MLLGLFENLVFVAADLRIGRWSAETPPATGVFKQSLIRALIEPVA